MSGLVGNSQRHVLSCRGSNKIYKKKLNWEVLKEGMLFCSNFGAKIKPFLLNHMSRSMIKPTEWLCAKRRLSSAWASVQSDQSSLCALWVAKDPSFLHAYSKDSAQTGRMPRLISLRWAHMPFCWFRHVVAHMCPVDLSSWMSLLPILGVTGSFYFQF